LSARCTFFFTAEKFIMPCLGKSIEDQMDGNNITELTPEERAEVIARVNADTAWLDEIYAALERSRRGISASFPYPGWW